MNPASEPAVALTDYAVAIEGAVFAWLLIRSDGNDPTLRWWFVVFFASIGGAALLGGTVHGFFPDAADPGRRILWAATLLTILVTALAAWLIAVTLHLNRRTATIVRAAAIAQFMIFSGIVVLGRRDFLIAIIAYLPATLFLLIALVAAYGRRRLPRLRWGISGLVLTFAAAAVQRLRIAAHPIYFDHNALYHVIQFAALWMIFLAARAIVSAQPPIRRVHAVAP